MAGNRQQFEFIYKIQTQEQWEEELKKPTIEVFDVYSGWAGPCNAITSTFKRIKLELNDQVTFCQVKADDIEDLKDYRDNSCPYFLFYNHGVFVDLVQGVNASLIEKKIKKQIENEKNNVPRVVFVPEKKEKPRTPLKLKKDKKIEKEYVIAILKPEVLRNDIIEKIIEMFMKNSFAIEEKKDIELTPEQVSIIYNDIPDDNPLKQKHIEYMSSNPCLAFLLAKEDPFPLLNELSGPENPTVAKAENPESIRSIYGVDEIKNAIYGSKNAASVLRDAEVLFPERLAEIKEQQEKLKVISARIQYTLIIIKPDAYKDGKKDEIFNIIKSNEFNIIAEKEILLSKDMAQEFYRDHISKSFYETLTKYMSSGPIYAAVIEKENAIKSIRQLIGPTNPEKAKEVAPNSIRALFGIDICKNAIHASDTISTAEKEINILFPEIEELKDDVKPIIERTLALIKPDLYAQEGKKDEIISIIQEKGYKIIDEHEFKMEPDTVREFYKEHENQSFFEDLVNYISSAPVYALVLEKLEAIQDLIYLVGPKNVEEAKISNPECLRAKYGSDILKNGIHCSSNVKGAIKEINLLFPSVDPLALQSSEVQRVLFLIKPDVYANHRTDEIRDTIINDGFKILAEKELVMNEETSSFIFKKHEGKSFFKELINWVSNKPVYGMVIERIDGISRLYRIKGPTDPSKAVRDAPGSLRAKYGTDGVKNVVHSSDSTEIAKEEIDLLFPELPELLKHEKTLALIKPDAYGSGKKDDIVKMINDNGFNIVAEKEYKMTMDIAKEFYKEHTGKPFFDTLTTWMSSAPIYAMKLEKENAVKAWRELMGPTNSEKAREQAPQSIRALFGTDGSQNAVHGSDSFASAERELKIIFPELYPKASTLALIKPDAYGAGKKDEIIKMIKDKGFDIAAEKEYNMSIDVAKEFYKEHENKSFYDDLTTWMSSAPIYAMKLDKVNAVKAWRELMGPTNSEKARELAPHSIRALFGTDGSQNAVHGSDSTASAIRELGLIFPEIDLDNTNNKSASEPQQPQSQNPVQGQNEPQKESQNEPQNDTKNDAQDNTQNNAQNDTQNQKTTTLALIKPDAYGAGKKDDIIKMIKDNGFTILAEKEYTMTMDVAKEFYKEHEGKPFYGDLTTWMSSAPIYAMKLEKEDAVKGWRTLMGPTNSEKAREEAPQSVRALFGTDGSQNAVHGSDSATSAERELSIIFPELNAKTTTLALIKPDAYGAGKKDDIIKMIKDNGFTILAEKEYTMTMDVAKEFYKEHEGKPFYGDLTTWMSSAPIYAMKLEKEDAVKGWRTLMGPTNSEKAREEAPQSVRALFGTDGSQNAVHGSDSATSTERELGIIFPELGPKTTTLALIKPDAYGAGKKDDIVKMIKDNNFNILAEKEYTMTIDTAKEFYKEHEGKPFYDDLTTWMSSAPIYAMKLEKANAVKEWRALMGPTNSEKAREEAPQSIRALFGTDGSQNAVHGSDSAASAERELSLIFPELK